MKSHVSLEENCFSVLCPVDFCLDLDSPEKNARSTFDSCSRLNATGLAWPELLCFFPKCFFRWRRKREASQKCLLSLCLSGLCLLCNSLCSRWRAWCHNVRCKAGVNAPLSVGGFFIWHIFELSNYKWNSVSCTKSTICLSSPTVCKQDPKKHLVPPKIYLNTWTLSTAVIEKYIFSNFTFTFIFLIKIYNAVD